jgi:hypothetical protein
VCAAKMLNEGVRKFARPAAVAGGGNPQLAQRLNRLLTLGDEHHRALRYRLLQLGQPVGQRT